MSDLRLERFFALREGAHLLPDGEPTALVPVHLGELQVGSGRLGICDILAFEMPLVVPVTAGSYPLVLTLAEVAESYDLRKSRDAYLSLVLSDEPSTSVEPAPVEAGSFDWRSEPSGGIAGMQGLHGVLTGDISTVAMVDAEALVACMPEDRQTWSDEFIMGPEDSWFARMDTEIDGPWGAYFGALPLAQRGENIGVVNARSNRIFPVLATRDVEGKLTGIHIDLLVLGQLSEEMKAFDGQSEFAAEFVAEAARETAEQRERALRQAARPGWIKRLFGG